MSNRKNTSRAPLTAVAIGLDQLRGLALKLGRYLIFTPRPVPVRIAHADRVRNRTRRDWRR